MTAKVKTTYELLYENPSYGNGPSLQGVTDWGHMRLDTPPKIITDFGCGRGGLADVVVGWERYQGIDIVETLPRKETETKVFAVYDLTNLTDDIGYADTGYCLDLMEHIHEADIPAVIKGIVENCDRVIWAIALNPAKHNDEFGDNLHVTLQDAEWWVKAMSEHTVIVDSMAIPGYLWMVTGTCCHEIACVVPDFPNLRRAPDGTYYLPRNNAVIEKQLDAILVRKPNQLVWRAGMPVHMAATTLKGLHVGAKLQIVGKGPSLDNLTREDLDVGAVVIGINEATLKLQELLKPNEFIHMQQDVGVDVKVDPKTLVVCHLKIANRFGPNKKVIHEDMGSFPPGLTAVEAIYLGHVMGCTEIEMLCFDACVDRNTGYANIVGYQPKMVAQHGSERFLRHRVTLEQAAGGIPISFRLPHPPESSPDITEQ